MAYSYCTKNRIIKQFVASNEPMYAYCKRIGIHPKLLYLWLEQANIHDKIIVRPRKDVLTHFPVEVKIKAVKMRKSGIMLKDIAKEIGCSIMCVHNWYKTYETKGEYALMGKNDLNKRSSKSKVNNSPQYIRELEESNEKLQLQVDILEATMKEIKKCPGLSEKNLPNTMKVRIINRLRPKFKLRILLDYLNMSKGTYCRINSKDKNYDKYARLRRIIYLMFKVNKCVYGYRRIWLKLRSVFIYVSDKLVLKLMNELGLVVYRKRMDKYSSYDVSRDTSYAPNLLARNFHSDIPFYKLTTDITEFKLHFGKIYLSPVLDLFDGMPIIWTISDSPNMDLVSGMLGKLQSILPKDSKPIMHSDRGWHYHNWRYEYNLERMNITQSMSKKGCSPDNAAMEGFFGHLKNEFFYNRDFSSYTKDEFINALNKWIIWYNKDRIKVGLGGMTPIQYRRSLRLTK